MSTISDKWNSIFEIALTSGNEEVVELCVGVCWRVCRRFEELKMIESVPVRKIYGYMDD